VTGEAFAALLKARRAGQGRWQARCPAHADRSPSLSIREGKDGLVLVHCFAGCSLEAILVALGLAHRDLFAGPPPSPQQTHRAAQERTQRDAEARNRRRAHGAACDRVRRWEAIVSALGAKLGRATENDGLAQAFHRACDKLHEAEIKAEKWNPCAG
jgi:hypothetical protein